ncbi:MAG: copper resistance protein CopC, partial [Vitreimonas sp.]
MRHIVIAVAVLLSPLFAAGPALGHTSIVETSIAENARLTAAPGTFTVEFSAPVGLASVALTNAQGRT